MTTNVKVLSWAIGLYVVFDIFGSSLVKNLNEPARLLYEWFPSLLLILTLAIGVIRIVSSGQSLEPFYHRLNEGDYLRLFFVLWSGYIPLAYDSLVGLYSFLAIAVLLFVFLLTVSCLEFYRKRELTLRLLGYMLFLWCLFAWGKNSYVVHYGVHVIGHYLEKPSYTTKYYVEIQNDDTNRIIKAIADISVGSRFEEHMTGEDYYGNETWVTEEYREIWISKIHFPTGSSILIRDQIEPLELGQSTFISDTRGKRWYIRILDEPVTSPSADRNRL